MRNVKLNRRGFLKSTSAAVIGAGIIGTKTYSIGTQEMSDEFPKIRDYRTLGRTGFKVSDIGTGYPFNEGTLRAALSCGINLIETSEMYDRGKNEILIGNVIKDFEREKLFIATKVSHGIKEFESVDDIIERANKSLERLQTKYIDCFMIHGAENSARAKNKLFHNAVNRLKKEGKIRFAGISCHGHSWMDNPEETFEEVLMTAIEDGRFDVIMLPFNFFEPEMGNRVLNACRASNIGTMIMKSIPLVLYEFFSEEKEKKEKEGGELSARYKIGYEKFKHQTEQANDFFSKYGMSGMEKMKDGAIQFILSNENVSTICCLFQNFDNIKKYIRLSGSRLEPENEAILSYCKNICSPLHCRIGCNSCEASCSHHLPINTILRYNYYFQAKNQEKRAIQLYKDLSGSKPDICINCEGFCEKACPYGVSVYSHLAIAHNNLHLNFT